MSLFEFLLELLIEVVGGSLFELLAWAIFEGLPQLASGRRGRLLLSTTAQLIVGMAAGVVSVVVFTTRLTPRSPMPGISLLLAPLGIGVVMHALGELWPDDRRPALFTFKGGAIFAFGMAVVRFLYFTLK